MAKSNIYIYTYNNYFNRIVKKESSLANYGTPEYVLTNTNFDYADGVSTSHVFNYNGNGDYLIVTDEENNILHRWFVIENKKTRGGQYIFTLRRDLMVDFYDLIVQAPMIINRAMITDPNNSLLFNPEGFSFNQIKQNETLLYDASHTPWYVLYFNKDYTGTNGDVNIDLDDSATYYTNNIDADYPVATYRYLENRAFYVNYTDEHDDGPSATNYYDVYKTDIVGKSTNIVNTYAGNISTRKWIWFDGAAASVRNLLEGTFGSIFTQQDINTLNGYVDTNYSNQINQAAYNNWRTKEGTFTVFDRSTDKKYSVTVNISYHRDFAYDASDQTIGSYMAGVIENNESTFPALDHTGGWGDNAFSHAVDCYTITISRTELPVSSALTFNLDFSNKSITEDAPYNVICIPKNTIQFAYDDSGTTKQLIVNNGVGDVITNYIINNLKDGKNLLDVQLLPYFPYVAQTNMVYDSTDNIGKGSLVNTIAAEQYYINTTANKNVFIAYLNSINSTFNLSHSLAIPNRDSDAALNKKLSNELDLYRLCSPNYNGQFEFSVAKNNGVSLFNVDMTLRPFNPYIHVNPSFDSLYGRDFDDARGLICNGDFSLPLITDAWAQYELNNKNYQDIFNRQIQHMDFTQEQERTMAGWNIASGAVSGGAMGALAGSKFGAKGMAIGAAVGAGASLAGGIADYMMMGERQREDKDLAIDSFNYQLGNIKAVPQSITKVTPLTYNNKIYPFVEYYTATEAEQNILTNKITYNSMTVNAIGTIQEYQLPEKTFISGTLIRLAGTGLANNEVFEIYDELKKGVYI